MTTASYQFIKRGNLFITPVGPTTADVSFPTQPFTKPREFSLWVGGRSEEPTFQMDSVRMPPSLYQEVRKDLMSFSPVEVSRSAFQRSDHAYIGVIDSKGKPYYFALDSRGISVREVDSTNERVWKNFDMLADQERSMASKQRRQAASAEMTQFARELSKPQLVIKAHSIGEEGTGFPTHKEDGTKIKKPSLYQKLRGLAGKPRTDIDEHGHTVADFPKMKLITKAEAHTGTMVALHIPADIAEKIAIPDGEPASSMHITLAYLGKNLTEEQKSAALCAVRRFAQQSGPIQALLGGVGRFSASHTSEGNDVVYLSVDSPDITRLRPKLLEELAAEGIEPSNAHGFVPHVTLSYVKTTANTPIKRFPPVAVEFSNISLTVADHKMQLPFTQPSLILNIAKSASWITSQLRAGKRVKHENGTHAYERTVMGTGKKEYAVISPGGSKTYHDTAEEAGHVAHGHTQLKKALPKKSKEEKVKKTPTVKASKKKAGAGGKTRYTYPNEKKKAKKPGGGAGAGGPKAQPLPLVVTQHDDSKNADPSEFANQLGVSVRTLQNCAKKLGREGFAKFMRSHLKRFSAKHRLDPDYWGTLYGKLQPGVG